MLIFAKGELRPRAFDLKATKTLQRSLFIVLLVILASVLVAQVASVVQSLGTFVWLLAPLGALAAAALIAALMLAVSFAFRKGPHRLFATLAIGLVVLDLPMLWGDIFLPALGPLVLVLFGVTALAVSNAVGASRAGSSHIPITVFAAVAGILVQGVIVSGFVATASGAYTVFLKAPSPQRAWVVEGSEYNPGALGSLDVNVVVRRDFYGLVRQERTIICESSRPDVRWVDERTLMVNGEIFDIFQNTPIHAR
ncbi:MAG: hypothetical protein M1389_03305 [Chloroflexi bacterium]|nr:hypothetical protein [Chloroflexota bacterium]